MHLTSDSSSTPLTAEEFANHIESLQPSRQLAVAVSGGGDSMALLVLAAEWAAARSVSLTALTVDHGMRPAAPAEAAQVAAWCGAVGVAHHTLRVTVPAPTSNVQLWARTQRYELLTGWARTTAGTELLLGHTLDDQAETFLLRLARGSGVDGLAAMAAVAERDGVRLLRPLLTVSRERLRATLRARGQEWIEDPSNSDWRFQRTRARQALTALAPLGLDVRRLAKTANTMARARDALTAVANELRTLAVHEGGLGEVLLDPQPFRTAEPEIALRVLGDVLRSVSGAVYRPRFRSLQSALQWLVSSGGPAGRTLHGCELRRGLDGRVLVVRELAACGAPITLAAGEAAVWDGRWQVQLADGASCTVGALGLDGDLQLRGQRHDWATHHWLARCTVPAFRRGNEIIAVPAIGPAALGQTAGATATLLAGAA